MGAADSGGAVAAGSSGIASGSTCAGADPSGSVSVVVDGPKAATVDSEGLMVGTFEITNVGFVVRRASPTTRTSTSASPGSSSAGTTTSTLNS
jgi:hypothetical protein